MIYDVTSGSQSINYWKQERLVLVYGGSGEGDKQHLWTNKSGSYASPIAVYTPDSDGYCNIDMTDYLRMVGSCTVYIKDEDESATTATIAVTVKGLINPASVMIPYHYGNAYSYIIPPYYMIAPETGKSIIAENCKTGSSSGASVTGNATMASNNRYITITGDFAYKAVSYGDARPYKLKPRFCGVQYAYVRWQSFTGVTRTHIFEVIKPTTAAADNYSLMPVDNEYIEVKGRVDSFTLRLKDLCPYDLWYYSDIITSSNVEISFDGTTYDRVQITTKNITLPDGDTKQNGKLEIGVNWKRYDAVAM